MTTQDLTTGTAAITAAFDENDLRNMLLSLAETADEIARGKAT